MSSRKFFMLLLLAASSVAAAVLASETPSPQVKTAPWKLVGQLEEACSCSSACPCWFGSKPTRMTCSGGQFLFIEKGRYGDVPLDGLAVGGFVQSPSGQSMMESIGKWNFNYFYIDSKANPEQREALKSLAEEVLLGDVSPKKQTRIVPITRQVNGKEHTITIGEYGKFSGHLVEGGLGGSAKIVNPPGADPFHKEYLQGNTTKLSYTDAEQNWDFAGSNYMFGTFEVDSEQFRKYAAMMSQKMKGSS